MSNNFISKIPFPAITICPQSKTDSNIFNLTSALNRIRNNDTLSQEESDSVHALFLVCNFKDQVNASEFNHVEKYFELSNDYINESKVFIWQQDIIAFNKYFHPIITEEGLCYSSNMLNEKDLYTEAMTPELRLPRGPPGSKWTIFGYENTTDPNVYPRRVFGSGISAGVQISLFMRFKDVDYACKQETNGYKVILHPPDELPKTSLHYHIIQLGAESHISVQPRVMSTTDNLRKYDPLKRQCYFQEDKKLKYFKHYNMAHCKMECFAGKIWSSWTEKFHIFPTIFYFPEFTLQACGCVVFWMPHEKGTKICHKLLYKCAVLAELMYMKYVRYKNLFNF